MGAAHTLRVVRDVSRSPASARRCGGEVGRSSSDGEFERPGSKHPRPVRGRGRDDDGGPSAVVLASGATVSASSDIVESAMTVLRIGYGRDASTEAKTPRNRAGRGSRGKSMAGGNATFERVRLGRATGASYHQRRAPATPVFTNIGTLRPTANAQPPRATGPRSVDTEIQAATDFTVRRGFLAVLDALHDTRKIDTVAPRRAAFLHGHADGKMTEAGIAFATRGPGGPMPRGLPRRFQIDPVTCSSATSRAATATAKASRNRLPASWTDRQWAARIGMIVGFRNTSTERSRRDPGRRAGVLALPWTC